jgi:hypothetical protein
MGHAPGLERCSAQPLSRVPVGSLWIFSTKGGVEAALSCGGAAASDGDAEVRFGYDARLLTGR